MIHWLNSDPQQGHDNNGYMITRKTQLWSLFRRKSGFHFGSLMPALKPEMNRVLSSFVSCVDTRPETGKKPIFKTVQNSIHLWLKRRHQGTNA
jgi:hypothetical protein